MQALGHQTRKGASSERQSQEAEEKIAKQKQLKQEKAGVHLLTEDWSKSLDQLQPEVRSALENLISSGHMKHGEIDSFEVCQILILF